MRTKMAASGCILGDSYGVLEADKLLPEVFHIEDDVLEYFSCEDIGGPIDAAGDLQLSGVTEEESYGEGSISELLMEVKSELHTDLCVPGDDLTDDLHWLSSFVEPDSFAAVNLPGGASSTYGGNFSSPARNSEHTTHMTICDAYYQSYQRSSPVSVLENSSSATSSELTGPSDYRDVSVPGRARSKRSRSRTGARIWTSRILSTTSSCTTSYSPVAVSEDSTVVDGGEQDDEEYSQSSSKRCNTSSNGRCSSKQGRKKSLEDNAQRCMHCETQKTPQWRTGPMGPKTLCNACGVRYKSGRLLPEYRPASSPTYVASKHSHSHKKVLEMRRERDFKQGSGRNLSTSV